MTSFYRLSSSNAAQQGTELITKASYQLRQTQKQLATGLKINNPADDPIAASRLTTLQQSLSNYAQYNKNCDLAMSRLEASENSLNDACDAIERIKVLTIQANNPAISSSDRQSLATEMSERLNQLVAVANTTFGGQQLFSGFKVETQTVSLQANGRYAYMGDNNNLTAQIGDYNTTPVAISGHSIFYQLNSATTTLSSSSGSASVTTPNAGLQAVGPANPLLYNDLNLNGVKIPAATSDGVSHYNASSSAIAVANAINQMSANYAQVPSLVSATANPNVLDLGSYSTGSLSGANLVLNGVAIVDPSSTEAGTLLAFNAVSAQTGVVASQPGGLGTDFLLTAADGRTIDLQTDGTGTASFSQLSLAAPSHMAQTATVSLQSSQAITLAGNNPQRVGLVAGTYGVRANTGTAQMSEVLISGVDPNNNPKGLPLAQANYQIVFNADNPNPNYSIYRLDNPTTPVSGFADVPYQDGAVISVEGLSCTISGTPQAGDSFQLTTTPALKQDAFSMVQDLITSLDKPVNAEQYPLQLNYNLSIAQENLDVILDNLLSVRSRLGTIQNMVTEQKSSNVRFNDLVLENISQLRDLDIVEASTKFTQGKVAVEAAQQSYVLIQKMSIFNFL